MKKSGFLIFLCFVISASCFATMPKKESKTAYISPLPAKVLADSLKWADYYYNIQRYKKAIPIYKKTLLNPKVDKIHVFKKLALSESALENPSESIQHVNEYLRLNFDPTFLSNEGFDPIRDSEEFAQLSNKVIPRITIWVFIYLFVALVGFYVVFIISLNKHIHPTSRFLIAFFIFIHSLFILNICIVQSNYLYEYPHTYLMSTWASFLYGPLLYYYFKTTSQKHRFRSIDLLHLLPTILLCVYMTIDVYSLSYEDKIQIILYKLWNGLNPSDSDKLVLIVVLKIVSLTVYGYFIGKIHQKSKSEKLLDEKKLIWQKNIYYIHIFYVFTYTAYGILIINDYSSGILYDASAISMAAMVIYVGYSANIQPDVFNGSYEYFNRLFPKYVNSGLTPSLSQELKENLTFLFAVEKIYKENNICLEMVAQRLNTTRHNASQVINEHFNVNFHELVNQYRIIEAKEILDNDPNKNLNIIDVAYEVGYNNKVTFNKAFKKDTSLTPSEYQKKKSGFSQKQFLL